MQENHLLKLLENVKDGSLPPAEALEKLRTLPTESVTDGLIDNHRKLRTGIPEVIYGASKSADQIIAIAGAMLHKGTPVLATRIDEQKAQQICNALPALQYHSRGGMLVANSSPTSPANYRGRTLVMAAGTSDIPVAEEANITLTAFGHPVDTLYDVGVAGLHRLLGNQRMLRDAKVIIVAAGMEGALPSVVGGLVSCPVIAVPTSVGYGASFGGIAALLGMLNSCAPGVAVVNIDNGFGAACMAETINRI